MKWFLTAMMIVLATSAFASSEYYRRAFFPGASLGRVSAGITYMQDRGYRWIYPSTAPDNICDVESIRRRHPSVDFSKFEVHSIGVFYNRAGYRVNICITTSQWPEIQEMLERQRFDGQPQA